MDNTCITVNTLDTNDNSHSEPESKIQYMKFLVMSPDNTILEVPSDDDKLVFT